MPSDPQGPRAPDAPTPPSANATAAPNAAPAPGTDVLAPTAGRGVAEGGAQVVALSPFRGDVARSLLRRGKALLQSDRLAEEVGELTALELYYVVKELGVDEASPLVLAADDEQFAILCDLDCWNLGSLDATELDAWLAPLAAQGPDVLAETFLRLDEEVQVLFLQASLRVLDNREQDGRAKDEDDAVDWPEDLPKDAPSKRTPEGFFTLIDTSMVDGGEEREVQPFALVDALMAHAPNEGFRLLTAARWELHSALTEQARHFRQARLADFGFDAPEDAVRLFAAPPALPPAPAQRTPGAATPVHLARPNRLALQDREGAGTGLIPAPYAEALAEGDCALTVALGEVRAPEVLAELERQLVAVISAAVVAYGDSPRNLGHVTQVACWVRDTLSLGLWLAAEARAPDAAGHDDGEPESRASDALRTAWADALVAVPLLHLHQRGMAAARPLQHRARTALQQEKVRAWADGAPEGGAHDPAAQARALLTALAEDRPLWGGQVPMRPERRVAWRRPADLAATRTQLDEVLAPLGA